MEIRWSIDEAFTFKNGEAIRFASAEDLASLPRGADLTDAEIAAIEQLAWI